MIIGIGTDLVDIRRIATSIEKTGERFVRRILSDSEVEQWQQISTSERANAFVAKRFAAKEAAVKAIGTGIGNGVSFQHFTVANLPSGQPVLTVAKEIEQLVGQPIKWHLTLSDERHYAQAFVIAEAIEPEE